MPRQTALASRYSLASLYLLERCRPNGLRLSVRERRLTCTLTLTLTRYASPDVFEMYVSSLRRRFKMHGLQRSGRRPDGLFIAIAHEWEVVQHAQSAPLAAPQLASCASSGQP